MGGISGGGGPHRLERRPLHLGPGGRAIPLPAATGADWYQAYDTAHGADGADGRLVSQHHGDADWTNWEMHPLGAEVVICIAGAATLIQRDAQGRETGIALAPGDYAINPPGIWHTADIAAPTTLIFITPGHGTQVKPR